jgi:hypothetical protein
MNGLDKIIKKERKQRCRKLKRLRKARDMSKHHREDVLKLSKVEKLLSNYEYFFSDLSNLARFILTVHNRDINRPKPPTLPPVRKKLM